MHLLRYVMFLLLLLLPSLVYSQALPDLPDLPSPSPPPSPSLLPSALADLINQPPAPPTAVPPGGSVVPIPGQPITPVPSATAVVSPVLSQSPEASPSASPQSEFINEDGICIRDIARPRPKLGKSQRRYAISVLMSAAAVGIASILYRGVYTWHPQKEYSVRRLFGIIIARLLIVSAVKGSAALVASITKASPDDSALDASGAFLTWGSAIFTRVYNEGICMTLAALDFAENDSVWDDKLKHFLDTRREVKVNGDDGEDGPAHDTGSGESDIEGGVKEGSKERPSTFQHMFSGRWERKLLLITAVVYFAAEIAVLVSNVLTLVGSFGTVQENAVFFSSDDEDGQCPFSSADAPVLVFVILFQGLYALTHQPSLVPLLTVSAFCPESRFKAVNKVVDKLRWLSCFVLLLWVTSSLTMPLLNAPLEPFFLAGDISLFWYVVIAPPSYSSTSYIITATYTCLAAAVGAVLIYRISISQRREKQLDTNS